MTDSIGNNEGPEHPADQLATLTREALHVIMADVIMAQNQRLQYVVDYIYDHVPFWHCNADGEPGWSPEEEHTARVLLEGVVSNLCGGGCTTCKGDESLHFERNREDRAWLDSTPVAVMATRLSFGSTGDTSTPVDCTDAPIGGVVYGAWKSYLTAYKSVF